MIVVDASVVLEVLLRGPFAARAELRMFARGETLHAPHLIDLEVVQVIRRHHLADRMTAAQGDRAVATWLAIPVRRWPHEALAPRIWALRNKLTAYDAAYIALAEVLDVPLVTTDAKLARASGHGARVEVVS